MYTNKEARPMSAYSMLFQSNSTNITASIRSAQKKTCILFLAPLSKKVMNFTVWNN